MLHASPRVAIRHCDEEANPVLIVTQLAKETSLSVPEDSCVVIKPNLSDLRGPDSGLTTDARVVEALVEYLNAKSRPKKISIVESDSWNRLANEAFDQLGYRDIESAYDNVKLVNLTRSPSVVTRLPFPCYYDRVRIPRVFLENDFFVSVAKLRTHHTVISGVLKNQFGCLPGRFKARYHPYLADILANLNLLLRPNWSLVDGLVGRDHRGAHRIGLLLASCDPVALDTVSARIMGFNAGKIGHIRRAAERSVGKMNDSEVILDGDAIFDLGSVIPEKLVGPNRLTRTIRDLAELMARISDRGHSVSSTFMQIAALSDGAAAYSTSQVLKRALNLETLRAACGSIKVRRRQDDL